MGVGLACKRRIGINYFIMLFNENAISERARNERKRQYRHMLEEQIRDNQRRKLQDQRSRNKIKTESE
jgi:hypothetical protein